MRKKILLFICILLGTHFAFADEAADYASLKQSFEDGFYSLTLRAGEGFLKKYPESSFKEDVLLLKGLSLFNLKKYPPAAEVLESLKNSQSLRIKDQACLYLAKLYRLSSQTDKAVELYNYLIQNSKDKKLLPLAHYGLGRLYFDNKEYHRAVKAWQNILDEKLPENIRASLVQDVVLAYFKLHDFTSAAGVINKYLQDNKAAFSYFSADLEFLKGNYKSSLDKFNKIINSDFPALWKQRGELGKVHALIELEKYKEAEDALSALEKGRLKEIDEEFYYLKAFLFYKKSEFSPAIRYYQRFIYKFKDSDWTPKAFLELIDCFYNLNKFKLAERTAERFFNAYPDSAFTDQMHHALGWVYYKEGSLEKAVKEFEWVAQNSKDVDLKINSLCRVGDILAEEGRIDEAMAQYNIVLKNYPDSFYAEYAQTQLGIYLLEKKDYEAAILALRAVLTNFPQSSFLDKVHFNLALAYFKKGDFKLALDEINTLLTSFPTSNLKNKALLQKAVLLYNLGYYEEVKKLITETETLRNTDYAHFILAKVYIGEKQYQLAVKEYNWLQENLKNQKLLPYLYLQTGELEFYLQQWNMAHADFQNAYRIAEETEVKEQALYWQAWCYYNEDKLEEALDIFTQLVNSKTLSEEARYNSALIFNSKGEKDKAIEILKNIAAGKSRFKRLAELKLGDIFKSLKDYNKAIQQYKALEKTPYDIIAAEASFKIGEIYEMEGNNDEAVLQYLSLGALYNPSLSFVNKARIRCGRLLENAGRFDEARKVYTAIASSGGEEAIYARERLKQLEKLKSRR